MEQIYKPSYMLVLMPEEAEMEHDRIASLIPPKFRKDYERGRQVVLAAETPAQDQQEQTTAQVAQLLAAITIAAPEQLVS
jgi:hypothetical protein